MLYSELLRKRVLANLDKVDSLGVGKLLSEIKGDTIVDFGFESHVSAPYISKLLASKNNGIFIPEFRLSLMNLNYQDFSNVLSFVSSKSQYENIKVYSLKKLLGDIIYLDENEKILTEISILLSYYLDGDIDMVREILGTDIIDEKVYPVSYYFYIINDREYIKVDNIATSNYFYQYLSKLNGVVDDMNYRVMDEGDYDIIHSCHSNLILYRDTYEKMKYKLKNRKNGFNTRIFVEDEMYDKVYTNAFIIDEKYCDDDLVNEFYFLYISILLFQKIYDDYLDNGLNNIGMDEMFQRNIDTDFGLNLVKETSIVKKLKKR